MTAPFCIVFTPSKFVNHVTRVPNSLRFALQPGLLEDPKRRRPFGTQRPERPKSDCGASCTKNAAQPRLIWSDCRSMQIDSSDTYGDPRMARAKLLINQRLNCSRLPAAHDAPPQIAALATRGGQGCSRGHEDQSGLFVLDVPEATCDRVGDGHHREGRATNAPDLDQIRVRTAKQTVAPPIDDNPYQ